MLRGWGWKEERWRKRMTAEKEMRGRKLSKEKG